MDPFSSLFRQFIFEAVADAMAQNAATPQDPPEKDEDRFFTVEELHDYLPGNPPIATIYAWSSKGLIPKTSLGRRVVFSKKRIDAWIAAKACPTNDEIGSIPIILKNRK